MISNRPTLQARKPLVNDVVRSFCYACRTNTRVWPMPIFGSKKSCEGWRPDKIDASMLLPFIQFAMVHQPNYILSMSHIILMSSWLRSFTEVERAYAVALMEKYYGIRTCEVSRPDNQPVLC